MRARASNLKIPDIKALRGLSRLLGKLHIPCCYHRFTEVTYDYDDNNVLIGTHDIVKEGYGFGLKESKDFVERWFDYSQPPIPEGFPAPAVSAPWMPYPRD